MNGRKWGLLLLLLFLAYVLRIFQLEDQSIWWDEGISLHLASATYNEIAENRLNNIHPPLYFWGLKVWVEQAGLNAFSARYFSLLAGWFQVALLIAVARRWFSLNTAFIAGILGAISAVSIIYSQETRVYTFLPLIYLGLLALTRELTRPRLRESGGGVRLWLLLGMAIWIGIHLHYITFFVVLYITIWAVIVFFRNRDWIGFKRWFLTLFLVFLSSLPWFLPLLFNWDNVTAEANVGTYLSEPVPLSFLVQQVWGFHLSGLAGFLGKDGTVTAVFAGAVGIALLFIFRIIHKNTRKDALTLMLHWLVPLSSALVVWSVRSFSHPRYIAIFVPGFLLFAAFLIMPARQLASNFGERMLKLYSVIVLLSLLTMSLWGLRLYFFDSQVAKDDIRGAARYLEDVAGINDLILVPDTDWSLMFEYKGQAPIEMPQLDDIDGGWSHMSDISMGRDRVFVIDYDEGSRDWLDKIPFSLSMAGTETGQTAFEGLRVREYQLDQPVSSPKMGDLKLNFFPLQIDGVWIEQDASGGSKLTVSLNWILAQEMVDPAHVSLRLLDHDGWEIVSDDTILRDEQGRPTVAWPVGETISTYHLLSLPPANPPFAYELVAQVYTRQGAGLQSIDLLDEQGNPVGQEATLGFAHISNKPSVDQGLEEMPFPLLAEPVEFAPGFNLLAANILQQTAAPGSKLDVHLLWQAVEEIDKDVKMELLLTQENNTLDMNDDDPSFGRYPTSLWRPGELVYERKPLGIPANASGEALISIRHDQEEFTISQILIESRDHMYEIPAIEHTLDQPFGEIARLQGFTLDKEEISPSDTLTLTLLWQSLVDTPTVDYAVFTHLLAEDGRLIGQHDSPPAQGSRPTTGWLVNEFILDPHDLTLKEDYEGEARIEVGLYDPRNGQRLQLEDGSDHFILPVTVLVENE